LTYPRERRILRISGRRRLNEREPLVDILEENDEILIVAGFVGFDKESLRIRVSNQRLILSAKAVNHRYHKSLNLPRRVIPKTMCVKHKNGVLEIRLKKSVEEKTIDKAAG
jgi:HSP20 family protein